MEKWQLEKPKRYMATNQTIHKRCMNMHSNSVFLKEVYADKPIIESWVS
jgi:hypothetical protein